MASGGTSDKDDFSLFLTVMSISTLIFLSHGHTMATHSRSAPMEILNTDVLEATKKKFSQEMSDPVTLIHFTQEPSRLVLPDYLKGQECLYCKETKQLLKEVTELSDKLELIVYDFMADKEKADDYGIDKIPATLLVGKENYGIRFFGIPSGYEYASFLEAIIDVSQGKSKLKTETIAKLKNIQKDIHIQVYVTPTCPYCTMSVRLAHQIALESPWVKSDMVESTEFPHLAHKYGVSGVPKTIINEDMSIEGSAPEETLLEKVLEAASAQD
jgi:glutaredoxin-like protein